MVVAVRLANSYSSRPLLVVAAGAVVYSIAAAGLGRTLLLQHLVARSEYPLTVRTPLRGGAAFRTRKVQLLLRRSRRSLDLRSLQPFNGPRGGQKCLGSPPEKNDLYPLPHDTSGVWRACELMARVPLARRYEENLWLPSFNPPPSPVRYRSHPQSSPVGASAARDGFRGARSYFTCTTIISGIGLPPCWTTWLPAWTPLPFAANTCAAPSHRSPPR